MTASTRWTQFDELNLTAVGPYSANSKNAAKVHAAPIIRTSDNSSNDD